jgi:exportin-5
MEGSTEGTGMLTTAAGASSATGGSQTQLLSQIHEALELVHSPHSSNEARQKASAFLEEIKGEDEAPYHGFTLAYDRNQKHIVRHYALSLLEYAIKLKWNSYSDAQADTLRGWVLQLSENISPDDPLYLRNKTAQLWVEVAKRSWGDQWLDMDEMLVKLWELNGSLVHKQLVLSVLETLSDDIFNGEDTTAALREAILKRACVEIFTPAVVLADINPDRPAATERYGDEGWLIRIGGLMRKCLASDVQNNEQYRACTVQSLAVLRSVMPWAVPSAISKAACVQDLQASLAAPNIPIQIVSRNIPSSATLEA